MLIPAHTCSWPASYPLERHFWRVLKVLQWLLSQLHSWCGSAMFFFCFSSSVDVLYWWIHLLAPLYSTSPTTHHENIKCYKVACPETLEVSCQGIRSELCGSEKNKENGPLLPSVHFCPLGYTCFVAPLCLLGSHVRTPSSAPAQSFLSDLGSWTGFTTLPTQSQGFGA